MNTTELIIRPYQPPDREPLSALWDSVFPNPNPHNTPAAIIAEKLAVQPQLLLVACHQNALIGSIIAGYDGHRGWLNLVAVNPKCQRRGIGKQLVDTAMTALKQLGCKKVNIQIRAGNEQVINFYKHLGFEPEARVSMGRFI